LIIIVAMTSIASFVTPTFDFGNAIRLLRFGFLILTSIFGIIGLEVALILTFIHLISLESLGQPYFQPIIPFKAKDLKDTIIRLPLKYLQTRPDIAKPLNKKRGNNGD
jgi:spore germination protein